MARQSPDSNGSIPPALTIVIGAPQRGWRMGRHIPWSQLVGGPRCGPAVPDREIGDRGAAALLLPMTDANMLDRRQSRSQLSEKKTPLMGG